MTNEHLRIWIDAMKSGEYSFTAQTLHSDSKHCALGVLSEELHCYPKYAGRLHLQYPSEEICTPSLQLWVIRLNDLSPTGSYNEVLADIEGAFEEYMTEVEAHDGVLV